MNKGSHMWGSVLDYIIYNMNPNHAYLSFREIDWLRRDKGAKLGWENHI